MRQPGEKVRVVITGKGGVGKTTLTALLAHCFARKGRTVLAVDGDPQQNLAPALGLGDREVQSIVPLSGRKEYIAEKIGAVPGRGGFIILNPDTADVVDRFSYPAGERIRLLVMGGVKNAGSGCLCPEYTLLSTVLRNAKYLPGDVVLLDTPAGLEHFGRAIAQGFSIALVVTDMSFNALAVARELCRLAHQCGIPRIVLVANRSTLSRESLPKDDPLSRYVTGVFEVPDDPCIRAHEPSVISVLEGECPAARAVVRLAQAICPEGGRGEHDP
jgi:CO dehydrogenase maturation factor